MTINNQANSNFGPDLAITKIYHGCQDSSDIVLSKRGTDVRLDIHAQKANRCRCIGIPQYCLCRMSKSAASLDLIPSGYNARMASEASAIGKCMTHNRLLEMALPYTSVRTLDVFPSYALQ